MKTIPQNKQTSFFTKNKDLLVAGSVILILSGAGAIWYYRKKKKVEATTLAANDQKNNTASPLLFNRPTLKKRITDNSGYPLQYGSRQKEVMILQRYLKIYKEDLGNTGKNRDGVDGILGPKTMRAAKKRLGKSKFNQKDIDGMKRALKTIGR